MFFQEVRLPQYPQKCILPMSAETFRKRKKITCCTKDFQLKIPKSLVLVHPKKEYKCCIEDVVLRFRKYSYR